VDEYLSRDSTKSPGIPQEQKLTREASALKYPAVLSFKNVQWDG
jgi:hypothetical protein